MTPLGMIYGLATRGRPNSHVKSIVDGIKMTDKLRQICIRIVLHSFIASHLTPRHGHQLESSAVILLQIGLTGCSVTSPGINHLLVPVMPRGPSNLTWERLITPETYSSSFFIILELMGATKAMALGLCQCNSLPVLSIFAFKAYGTVSLQGAGTAVFCTATRIVPICLGRAVFGGVEWVAVAFAGVPITPACFAKVSDPILKSVLPPTGER